MKKFREIVHGWLNNPANGGWIVVLAVMIILLWVAVAGAHAKTTGAKLYDAPDVDDYYEHLRMPDIPSTPCCGVADVYFADEQEQAPDGTIIAIITDTRPDHRVLPDGRVIDREHIPVGTRIPIPAYKLRKVPIANPSGHTLVWLGSPSEDPDAHYHIVYCYEPQALL